MVIGSSTDSRRTPAASPSAARALLAIPARLPLVVSGGLRRFGEDPRRGWAAAKRAAPWLRRWIPAPRPGLDQVLRAVAEDRWDDACAAEAEVEPDDRGSARMAIRRSSGDLSVVAASRPRDREQRRQVRAARRDVRLWTSALPTWAARHREPGPVSGPHTDALRVMHVVTNALPRVQAGSTIRTHRIAAAQGANGWQVAVATRPGFPVFHGDVLAPRDREYDGVRYVSLLPRWMPSADRIFEPYAELLGAAVDEWRPHVLHAASDHVNARAALEVGRRRDLPVAYEARTLPEESWLSRHGGEIARERELFGLMKQRHREVLLGADVITTLGEHLKSVICEQGVDPSRVFVVPNAVSDEFLRPRTPAPEARALRGIPGGELLIGTVTTMYSYEGLETLIEATAHLRRSGLDARLLLVGDGPARERWLSLAQDLGVPTTAPGRVPVTEVTAYLDALDVFALPRRDDAITRWVTALKPLEAQARAIPVVGTDLPAVAEVLAPGSIRVAGDDPGVWAQELSRFTDPLLREEQGRQAQEWIRACRTWPHVLDGYRSAYSFLGVDPGDMVGV